MNFSSSRQQVLWIQYQEPSTLCRMPLSCPGVLSRCSPEVGPSSLPVPQHMSLVAQPGLVPPNVHSSPEPLKAWGWEEAHRQGRSSPS